MTWLKLTSASHFQLINQYKNIKGNLLKCNSNIHFNKQSINRNVITTLCYWLNIEAINNPIIKIQEFAKKCNILQYKVFTIKALEFRDILTLSWGSSYESVHQYLYITLIINW